MIKSICVITPEYPSENRPYMFTFVDQLVCAMADAGTEVYVITPHDRFKPESKGEHNRIRQTPGGKDVKIYSPAVLTLTTRKIGPVNMSLLSERLFSRAVQKTITKNHLKPDILYAHFLFPAGTCAATLGKKLGIPSVCAFGESSLWSIREIGLERARKKLKNLFKEKCLDQHQENSIIK